MPGEALRLSLIFSLTTHGVAYCLIRPTVWHEWSEVLGRPIRETWRLTTFYPLALWPT